MARHAAPRSPRSRRRLIVGLASLFGVAATVALGALVAPTNLPAAQYRLPPIWATPAPSSPAPITVAEPTPDHLPSEWVAARDASRAEYEQRKAAEQAAAAESAQRLQEAAERASRDEEAEAAAEAAREATFTAESVPEKAAPQAPVEEPASVVVAEPAGDLQTYALQLLDGDTAELAALEKLWGRESGWNPEAQNPSSTAYGIAQFLDSTWAGTGIAKTDDPYRQIQAGLIYINARYGSPSAALAHSNATGWY